MCLCPSVCLPAARLSWGLLFLFLCSSSPQPESAEASGGLSKGKRVSLFSVHTTTLVRAGGTGGALGSAWPGPWVPPGCCSPPLPLWSPRRWCTPCCSPLGAWFALLLLSTGLMQCNYGGCVRRSEGKGNRKDCRVVFWVKPAK